MKTKALLGLSLLSITLLLPSTSPGQPADSCMELYRGFAHRTHVEARVFQTLGIVGGVASVGLAIIRPNEIPRLMVGGIAAPLSWYGGHFVNRRAKFSALVAATLYEVSNNLPGDALVTLTNYVNEIVFSKKLVSDPLYDLPSQEFGPQEEQQARLKYLYIAPESVFKAVRQLLDEGTMCPGGKLVLTPTEFNAAVVDRLVPRN